jgi:hypothetical protein
VLDESLDSIPLYPRRRLVGIPSGGSVSIRRGGRSDAVSSRPYRPGDQVQMIDWKASARLSSARNHDEFIVRERRAEETPSVVLVVDRRPGMALYPRELPWLHKPDAVRRIAHLLIRSAAQHRAPLGYLDVASHAGENDAGLAFWRNPRADAGAWRRSMVDDVDGPFDAPEDGLERAFEFLGTRRTAVPLGSFVFVVSDFLVMPSFEVWTRAVTHGWDVVPVIVQDPVWEQSFPPIDGVLVTFADAADGRPRRVRLGAQDVAERRRTHVDRLAEIRAGFARLGLDSVLVGSSDPARIGEVFLEWARLRLEPGLAW